MTIAIRPATPADLPLIAQFIRDLADYEKLAHEVRFDEAKLGEKLFGPRPYAEVLIGEVDPGDSIGVNLGFGFAVNNRFSFSLGYKHNYIRPTSTELNNITEKSDDLQIGALTFGMSYRITDRFSLNGNFEFGVTEDAPDMRFVLRVPVVF